MCGPELYAGVINYVLMILSSIRRYLESDHHQRHSNGQSLDDLLRAFAYDDTDSGVAREQLDFDINGLVLHSSLLVCSWCASRSELDSDEIAVVREIVEHVKAVLLWRQAKDQVVFVTLAIMERILHKSYLARKEFCEGGGVRTFLMSLQWLSMPTVRGWMVLVAHGEEPNGGHAHLPLPRSRFGRAVLLLFPLLCSLLFCITSHYTR